MYRVPVISKIGKKLMPTKPRRARLWIKEGKAIGKFNKLGQFYVQLLTSPSGEETQPIAVGIDAGKHYSGIAVQSAKYTLFTAHLDLPFQKVKERMEQRRMMRRTRRSRRINRKLPFKLRNHRQKRFANRKKAKLPPSIRANRELELRVVKELAKLFPISNIVYEYVEARGNKGFSPVMVGQKVMLTWLEKIAPVTTKFGWETAIAREHLGLSKDKTDKSKQTPFTHAVDGVALASYQFINRYQFLDPLRKVRGQRWWGEVVITDAPFVVIKRPPVSKRQLHLLQPSKGGIRRKYGGTVTRHGLRKGDLVEAEKAGLTYRGWVSGDTKTQVSVSDFNWKRLGRFTSKKLTLLTHNTNLIVLRSSGLGAALFRRR